MFAIEAKALLRCGGTLIPALRHLEVSKIKGLGRTGWYAGRFQTFVGAVITVVALDCLFCHRIKIDGPIGTSFGTSAHHGWYLCNAVV